MTATVIFMGVFIVVVTVGILISKQQRDAAWKQFASEIGAEFVESGFGASKVQARFKEWTITLDTYSVTDSLYTRMKAPFQNKDGFQFTVSRAGLVSSLDKALGTKQIEIGDPDFDRDFVIRGNNESKARALFANQRIRQLVQAQKSIMFGIKNNDLFFETQGLIKDVERLKSLVELLKETLTQLEG